MPVGKAGRFSDKITYAVALASVLVTTLADCGRPKPSDTPPAGSTAGAALTIDSVPIAQVPGTGLDGKPNFGAAGAPTRLADGRIMVSDRSVASLLIFDPSGFQVGSIGKRGRGPGEFTAPIPLGRCGGDSAWVWDPALRKIAVITPEGTLAREFPMQGATLRPVCTPDGRLVVMRAPAGRLAPAPGESPDKLPLAPLILMNAQGDSIAPLMKVPVGDFRPLGAHTIVAAGPDRFYVATGTTDSAEAYDYSGKRLGALRIADPPRPMTDQDFERAVDLALADARSPAEREAGRKQILALGKPEQVAPYRLVWVDPTGAVWAVLSPYGDSATKIRATAPDGTVLGDFTLPDRFTPFDVGRDYLLGLAESANGEQVVREYRVRGEGAAIVQRRRSNERGSFASRR